MNQRPICILPIISKTIEKWIVEQLINHLCYLMHTMKFRFHVNYSTKTAINVILEKVKFSLDTFVDAVFLDLKRTFDTVDHKTLLTRLMKFNFSQWVIPWIKSYLSNL